MGRGGEGGSGGKKRQEKNKMKLITALQRLNKLLNFGSVSIERLLQLSKAAE